MTSFVTALRSFVIAKFTREFKPGAFSFEKRILSYTQMSEAQVRRNTALSLASMLFDKLVQARVRAVAVRPRSPETHRSSPTASIVDPQRGW